jgi:hypothetical protein
VLRDGLNGELTASLHLHAIDADILDVVVVPVVRIAADYACLVEEETAVAAVEPEQRHQVEQINVLVDDHLLPGGAVHPLDFTRVSLVAACELEELLAYRRVLVQA